MNVFASEFRSGSPFRGEQEGPILWNHVVFAPSFELQSSRASVLDSSHNSILNLDRQMTAKQSGSA